MPSTLPDQSFRFGAFELDKRTGELRKRGVKIKLQDQPLQILILLLDRTGEAVSREEIRRKLWSENTFVDFDNAISSAVRKLREALNDSSETPRFIETVARHGYRFVCPIGAPDEAASLRAISAAEQVSSDTRPSGMEDLAEQANAVPLSCAATDEKARIDAPVNGQPATAHQPEERIRDSHLSPDIKDDPSRPQTRIGMSLTRGLRRALTAAIILLALIAAWGPAGVRVRRGREPAGERHLFTFHRFSGR